MQVGTRIITHKIIEKHYSNNKSLNKSTEMAHTCSMNQLDLSNLREISEIAHQYGSLVIGDGVSFAPHGFPDVKDLGVDFYTFSLYKTYGPHLGILYGKEEILKDLPNQNH